MTLVVTSAAIEGRLAPTDLTVSPGELVAVIGPNGGGKTSLLRAIARADGATGTIRIGEKDLDRSTEAERRRALAFLPASHEIHWPITVRDLVRLGGADPDTVSALLEEFELSSLATRPANQMSTGQRSRALLARALSGDPSLLILDEPLSNLEPYWVERCLTKFRTLAQAGKMVLVSLHDLSQLHRFDRVLLVDGGRVLNDEAPASLMASERFETIFRVRRNGDGWEISPPGDQRSSQ